MQMWEYTKIVIEKIRRSDGYFDLKIKVGEDKAKLYSHPLGIDELLNITTDLALTGWEKYSDKTVDNVQIIVFKRFKGD